MTAPLRGRLPEVSTAARLWVAALLAVIPLGFVWAKSKGYVTPGVFGPMTCDYDGTDCDPGVYTAGMYVPGTTEHVSDAPVRLFLVAAAVAVIVVATRVRTAGTRRLARLAVGSLIVAALLAVGARATTTAACAALAAAAVAPLVWSRGVGRAVLAGRRPTA
jgi:hypothetical protein